MSILLLIFSANFSHAQKKEQLRVSDSASFEKGDSLDTVVLTDVDGKVFLEIPEAVVATNVNDGTRFTGEVLSPNFIALPGKTPKTRMKEIFSFEVLGDNGNQLKFVDKIMTLTPRNRLRLEILEPEKVVSGPRPKVIYVVKADGVRDPNLWRFINDDDGWERIGGTYNTENGANIFTAKISSTGKYSIIDSAPLPTDSVDDYAIPETVESLTETIDRLSAQREAMMLELGLSNEEELPPFLSDVVDEGEVFPDNVEIPSLETPEISEIPAIESEFTQTDDKTRVIPALTEDGYLQEPSPEPPLEYETQNQLVNTIPEGELPSTGKIDDENSNTFVFVLLGVFGLIGVSIYFAFRKQEY